jgi:iron only hydrogenase large subunit-like protein
MIKQAGIDFTSLPDEEMDRPLGVSSGAGDIFANTGGVMEAALRSAYEIITGRELPFDGLHVAPITGLKGIKEASIKIEGTVEDWSFLEGITLNVAVASGLSNANKVVEMVKSGQANYHFIEIMTCPGGCIGGGGQPRFTTNEIRAKRIAAIYEEDEKKQLRKSHDNPKIKQIYGEFLGFPLGEASHHLLHTKYTKKERV